VNALEKAGFVVGRINGSHHIMRHPDGRRTTVPVHAGRDIRPGRCGTSCGTRASLSMTSGGCSSADGVADAARQVLPESENQR
jgi:hypothetical protein